MLDGSEALTHTEAQTEFVLGKALFYFGAAVIAVVAAASTLFYATSSMG